MSGTTPNVLYHRANERKTSEQLRRERAPQRFPRLGTVNLPIGTGALQSIAHRRSEDRADGVTAPTLQQVIQVMESHIRPRGVMDEHEIIRPHGLGQGQESRQH